MAVAVDIRPATVEQADIISLLGRMTFSETFGYLFANHPGELGSYLEETFGVAKIRRSIGLSRNHYWLAYVDELPVGYAKLKYPSDTDLLVGPDVAQLQKIYIVRDHLAMGIGGPLLQAVRERAIARGARVMWLAVLSENARAIGFYRRHGFNGLGKDRFTIGSQTFQFDLLSSMLV